MTEKKEIRNIKIFGNGRLYNPETGEYFVRFNEKGEALVNKTEAQAVKKYHPQVLFKGQKKKPVQLNKRNHTPPKSMKEVFGKPLRIPIKEA